MTRTDLLKGVYFARWAAIVGFGVGAEALARHGDTAFAVAVAALFLVVLLSGRVQAVFWRELLAGLHDLNQRDYQASKVHSERFLTQMRQRPWLRHLIGLGPSSYSLSAEAMALNNLGAAEMALNEFEAARAHLEQAITADPFCPLPFRNMGTLAVRTGSTEEAGPWIDKAEELGLRGGWSDQLVKRSQRRNAELSTTGSLSDRSSGGR